MAWGRVGVRVGNGVGNEGTDDTLMLPAGERCVLISFSD